MGTFVSSFSSMAELAQNSGQQDTIDLLIYYSFDLNGFTVEQLLEQWQLRYPVQWLCSAVIEALYQGRYKAISVEQILTLWKRRGQPLLHFNHEFERIIRSSPPQDLTPESEPTSGSSAEPPLDPPTEPSVQEKISDPALPSGIEVQSAPNADEKILEEKSPPEVKPWSEEKVAASSAPPSAATGPSTTPSPRPDLKLPEPEIKPFPENLETDLSIEDTHSIFNEKGDRPPLLITQPPKTLFLDSSFLNTTESDPPVTDDSTALAAASPLSEPPISTFRPRRNPDGDTANLMEWSHAPISIQPIHQFIPMGATSDFHSKLKAVAQIAVGAGEIRPAQISSEQSAADSDRTDPDG